jgi:UDP-N-acetylmuramoyl-tripeptide--D-alanyl-D-alanine ligase
LPLTILKLGIGYERAVLEMGFYVPGEIQFLCDIAQPQIGVVTNVGTVHAERAGSQEAIAKGKSELIQLFLQMVVAILNFDDPWVRKMEEKSKARVFFYGLSPEADLWADEIEGLGLDGIRFRLHYKGETLHATHSHDWAALRSYRFARRLCWVKRRLDLAGYFRRLIAWTCSITSRGGS